MNIADLSPALARIEKIGRCAIISADNPPVNALSAALREALYAAVVEADDDGDVEAIILACDGRTFFAGADIREFGKPPREPALRTLIERLERCLKPTIAAVHGTALGGGLELALGAEYRIASRQARCGLPEVDIGLIPGAGGTQRLPRIVGIPAALDIVTSARQLGAEEALRLGLFDRLADDSLLRAAAIDFAEEILDGAAPHPIDSRRSLAADLAGFEDAAAGLRHRKARAFRGLAAPEQAIRAIEAAVRLPFADGMVEERRLFDELMKTDQPAALRHVFFAQREATRALDPAAGGGLRTIERVGIIGAGTMGGGIAMNFLNAGMPVVLVERTDEALAQGLATIRRNYGISVDRGSLTAEEVETRLQHILPSTDMDPLASCDLIIEAVFEDVAVKRQVFAQIDKIARPGAILATNTSYLDVDEIADATARPSDVIGLHFFSPANVMKLLEIVKTPRSDPGALASAAGLARRIGKIGVVVGNGWGFVGNRMLQARQRQAERLILEGATPWQVDEVISDFGFPMGPFQMRDLVGLDVGWNIDDSASRSVREILNEMGRHGQKSGGGFYDYTDGRKALPSPVALEIIEAFADRNAIPRRTIGASEIRDRILLAMINEAANILAEGIARHAADIDTIWITGYNWPRWTGGPLYWADRVGLPAIVDRLTELAALDIALRPAPLLVALASEGKGFHA